MPVRALVLSAAGDWLGCAANPVRGRSRLPPARADAARKARRETRDEVFWGSEVISKAGIDAEREEWVDLCEGGGLAAIEFRCRIGFVEDVVDVEVEIEVFRELIAGLDVEHIAVALIGK